MKYLVCLLLFIPCLCLAETRSVIYIDSLLASPLAGDEWVSLKNIHTESVSLSGWKLCDKTNKCVKVSDTVASQKTLSIKTTFLNNTGDTITVFDACGQVVDTVTYPSMKKDVVWYRDQPIITKTEKTPSSKVAAITQTTKSEERTPVLSKLLPWINVPTVLASSEGLELVVSVPLGVFDDKAFYAQNEETGYLISFASTIDPPVLEEGMVIHVFVQTQEKAGRNLIKITQNDQIQVTDEIREIQPKEGGGFGQLIEASGVVSDKTAYGFVLLGEKDINVALKKKTGLSFTNIKKQQEWSVLGIQEFKTDGSIVIWPRYEEDMQRIYADTQISTQDFSELLTSVQNQRFWLYVVGFVLMGIGIVGYLGYKYRYLWQKEVSVDETT